MRIGMGLALALVIGCVGAGAQATAKQSPQPGMLGVPEISNDPEKARQDQLREKLAIDERRKKILKDTERLLALANELKAEVDKSTKNELSLDVVKKAAEIERLAHDVKERMRN